LEGVDAQVGIESVISEQPNSAGGLSLLQNHVERGGVAVHRQLEVFPLTGVNSHVDDLV